ncbi:MAG: inositol monophosphatase family protein [Chloroflexota bacterium]
MDIPPTIEFIEKVARHAGDTLLQHFGKDQELLRLRATVKEAVTTYDRLIDHLIVQDITDRYPEHSLFTEESGRLAGDPDWLWIVDSLDGTSDFASSNPLFCVCIALMHKAQLLLGAVYAPAIREFYLAEKGNGAYLNQRRIHVSETSELTHSYVFYCEGGEKDRQRTGAILSRVYPQVTDLRKLGAAGLETAWVAAGKGDAYYTTRIEPWDVAAGVLLVEEAGGKVTDFDGNPWKPQTSDLLFSNGRLHAAVQALL